MQPWRGTYLRALLTESTPRETSKSGQLSPSSSPLLSPVWAANRIRVPKPRLFRGVEEFPEVLRSEHLHLLCRISWGRHHVSNVPDSYAPLDCILEGFVQDPVGLVDGRTR